MIERVRESIGCLGHPGRTANVDLGGITSRKTVFVTGFCGRPVSSSGLCVRKSGTRKLVVRAGGGFIASLGVIESFVGMLESRAVYNGDIIGHASFVFLSSGSGSVARERGGG